MLDNNIKVSIVIVCMNNLDNLYPCLNSVRKFTQIEYETLVVAYLFSKENLTKVRTDFPWVTFIESNEYRGFSENNNLALRQAKGEYCFVLNDDTEMTMPVIDMLLDDYKKMPANVACVSPKTIYPNGDFQSCGRPPHTFFTYILTLLQLYDEQKDKRWIKKEGLFRSYNLVGAAFMIKTDLFKSIGWFDEYFFFCPEDIKVGEDLNKLGYECWVDSEIVLIHKEGQSSHSGINKTQLATTPASVKGCLRFYSDGKWYKKIVVTPLTFIYHLCKAVAFSLKGLSVQQPNEYMIKAKASWNTVKYAFGNKTPKEIFIQIYKTL